MKKVTISQSSVNVTRQIIKNELKYFKSELADELVDRKTFVDFKDRLFNNLNKIGKLETVFKTS